MQGRTDMATSIIPILLRIKPCPLPLCSIYELPAMYNSNLLQYRFAKTHCPHRWFNGPGNSCKRQMGRSTMPLVAIEQPSVDGWM